MEILFRVILCTLLYLASQSVGAQTQPLRDDVLIVVNDNSIDSPKLGSYYAQRRGIAPENIVHVRVPDSFFINWDEFRSLRDQLINFMQLHTLNDPALVPAVCLDGDPPYYCADSAGQLREHSRIRYLVTTRGVPSRVVVTGSSLFSANSPASVDNYLKYWLLNAFSDDVAFHFTERETAFADGRGMRTVQPAVDGELIVGRIDGLDLNAAKGLVDRTQAVEEAGIYGTWYGSTKFFRLQDASTGTAIYPKSGSKLDGWRYMLGVWGENRAECVDYLDAAGVLPEGKAPAHCRIKINDDSNPAAQTTLGISYPAPGNGRSRSPQAVDALIYQGWLDGQATIGSFNALLNWRKDAGCNVMLCDTAMDPAACRASSDDIYAELNTGCVGVADGFIGYNHQSYPVSYLAIWPTDWYQSTNTGSNGWFSNGHGDVNQLAFPEVRSDAGSDDGFSLWFRNADQVVRPLCYAGNNFSVAATAPCVDQRRLVLTQRITLPSRTLDASSAPVYRVSLRYKTQNFASSVPLRVRLFVHETGAGNKQIDYGAQTLTTLTPVDTNWTAAEVQYTLDPLRHTGNDYDGIKITLDTAGAFVGDLGLDVVSVQEVTAGVELVSNGTFSQGHHQVTTGDHAANFLNRLGGVAVWGSVGHHQSGGCAFCFNGLETMTYFLRGLPLGDAVWFNESNNSGILYGDPLYSPVAIRINPVNAADTVAGTVELSGSTVNGRNPALVSTNYRVDMCPGDDFFVCDRTPGAWQSTGISGQGGTENASLGTLDATNVAPGMHTLRLQVTSTNLASGRSQTLADYYPVEVQEVIPPPVVDPVLAPPPPPPPPEIQPPGTGEGPVLAPPVIQPSGTGEGKEVLKIEACGKETNFGAYGIHFSPDGVWRMKTPSVSYSGKYKVVIPGEKFSLRMRKKSRAKLYKHIGKAGKSLCKVKKGLLSPRFKRFIVTLDEINGVMQAVLIVKYKATDGMTRKRGKYKIVFNAVLPGNLIK